MSEQHAVGYKADVGKNRLTLIMHGFARALLEVGKVGTFGAQKYTDNGWCEVVNAEQRYTDALYRHLLAEATNEVFDEESGLLHSAHSCWNALARLELQLRNSKQ